MDSISRPEKRKAEEEDYEESSKKPFIEDSSALDQFYEANNISLDVKAEEEYVPVSYSIDSKGDDETEQKEERDLREETEEYEPVKEETPAPLETVVPFDRLIILHLEATCDENPTNPAAVQVTKENSEIIGNAY